MYVDSLSLLSSTLFSDILSSESSMFTAFAADSAAEPMCVCRNYKRQIGTRSDNVRICALFDRYTLTSEQGPRRQEFGTSYVRWAPNTS